MVTTAGLLGAGMGLFVQLYSNGVRKLPLMRHPWEHVLAMGLGSAFGNAVVKWEDHLQVQLDKLIEDAKTSNNKRYLGTMRAVED
ncbi:hypothetical protein MPTK1_6g07830 [Marchantia polymorpha subsp. ruderalis]|uniref:Excitatory amino acid transporter n=2 Tax=Marchantia polymorpha TaxID=3197 RepID=A0AAF6BPN7_MARPO|nr:hypothetical protein Mapa_000533 [Marchantia paleacea]PTQ38172.1 hypothetical protein MARPO_0053s0096 [Marchantia polymorpha]BBN13971.1 hypothetical protein Mp_6g07830 [Marchantia polymorpha subsp. ruderalis]|eukprot:PTQ38172.1 hypothetical protein MARPO_0053s0096 [Marchantia polymorpha]